MSTKNDNFKMKENDICMNRYDYKELTVVLDYEIKMLSCDDGLVRV